MSWAVDFVVISTLSAVMTAASLELKITPMGEKFIRSLGTSIVFTCEVTGARESNVRIQWLDKSSREIAESPGRRIYVEKGSLYSKKLYVTTIEDVDYGQYHCIATAGGSSRLSKTVELFTFKDITFDHVPNPQHPAIYSNAIILCHVSGSPEPEVSWRHNGRQLENDHRYRKLKNGLQIMNITLADDGNYTCRAEVENEGRYDERRITVAVHIPPVVVEGPGYVKEVEGRYVSLSCRAEGLPMPKFEFYKDRRGKVLLSTDRVHVDTDGGRITFRPVKKEDEGTYTCKALNDVGDASRTGNLTVFVPPQIYEFQNITKRELETGTLICRSHGDPTPTMSFRKEGNQYAYQLGSNDNAHVHVSKRTTTSGELELMIRSLTPEDATLYTCTSKNIAGQDNKTAFIDVHFKPLFDKENKNQVYSWAGTKHNMSCHVLAQPMPMIRWKHFGRILENNETFQIFNLGRHSYLQVRIKDADQSWIYGDYVCQAENAVGSKEFRIQLNRATVPDEPRRVDVKEVSPNQVVLEVDPPKENGGVRVIGYRVEFENSVQDISIIGNLGLQGDDFRFSKNPYLTFPPDRSLVSSGAQLSIDNLRPGTKYFFRIRAKNEVGVGNSVEHVVTTANLTNPYRIKLTSSREGRVGGGREYRITWEQPKTGGRPIQKYEFRYRKIKTVGEDLAGKVEDWKYETVNDNLARPMLSYTLQHLAPSTEYQLQVIAKNELGNSPPNEDFFFQTPQGGDAEPTQVRAFVSPAAGIGIAIAIFLIILIIVDISCYFLNGCGFTMFICVHLCEKFQLKNDNEDLEAADSNVILKQPLQHVEEGKTRRHPDMTELEEMEEGTGYIKAPLHGSNQLEEDDKKSSSNRKSVLSQGDERWKDVVQELEKELSIKRSLSENESHDTKERREKPEILISEDPVFPDTAAEGELEKGWQPMELEENPADDTKSALDLSKFSEAKDSHAENEERNPRVDEEEPEEEEPEEECESNVPDDVEEQKKLMMNDEENVQFLDKEAEEADEETQSLTSYDDKQETKEANSLSEERQSLIEGSPERNRDPGSPVRSNWGSSFMKADDHLDLMADTDDQRPLLEETSATNSDFNEDCSESNSDQNAVASDNHDTF